MIAAKNLLCKKLQNVSVNVLLICNMKSTTNMKMKGICKKLINTVAIKTDDSD
jgi:hypothetical protein